jgi:PTS system fructose-specific IIC component
MELAKYLRTGSIAARLKASGKWEAIDELLDLLVRQGLVSDRALARRDLEKRELQMSTGLEDGLAVPHAKSAGVKELTVALGLAPAGIDFGGLDGKPARVIALVLSAVGSTGPHIECISELVRRYVRPEVRNMLENAQNAEDIIKAFAR